MSSIVALDIGDIYIGVAFSEIESGFVFPVKTFKRTNSIKADVRAVDEELKKLFAVKVILGNPVNEDSFQFEKNRDFVERLVKRNSSIEFKYIDEKYSSVEAETELISLDVSRKKRKCVIDQLAAVIILERYLNEIEMEKK